MTESEFWLRLAYRISREMAHSQQNTVRFMACDCLEREPGVVAEDGFDWIVGHADIMGGDEGCESYGFRLLLGIEGSAREVTDWSALLPSESSTDWLLVDRPQNYIEIRPKSGKLE